MYSRDTTGAVRGIKCALLYGNDTVSKDATDMNVTRNGKRLCHNWSS